MKEITVYEFNELNEEAKQKAINKLRYINVDCFEWYEYILQDFREQATEKGLNIKYDEISFDVSCGQGSGASFTCEDIETEKLLNALNITFKSKVLKKLFCENVSIDIKRTSYHYTHKYTVICVINYTELSHYSMIRDCIYKRIDNYLYSKSEELEEKLTELKNTMCDTLYNNLESEYEYQTSDEAVIEAIENNEYYFFENGRIA